MTYSEKLKDPRWQKMRLGVMERDDFACVICQDSESTLHIHHCYYGKGKDPWDYDSRHLMTLCQDCHKHVENQREEILKTMNWEVQISSLHTLATCGDPYLLSEVASAFVGATSKSALKARARMIRQAIMFLSNKAEEFEGKSKTKLKAAR